jgi:hypothetical protein
MNAERLHAIAAAVSSDLAATGTLTTLKQLRDALQNQVQEPQQPGHQQQVVTSIAYQHPAPQAELLRDPLVQTRGIQIDKVERVLIRAG